MFSFWKCHATTIALSLSLLLLLSSISLGSAVPLDSNGSVPSRTTKMTKKSKTEGASPLSSPRNDKPFTLRIMPLGASITYGFRSTDGNGYREHLRERLRSEGWKVNMVGSLKAGTMFDNDNEGHSGFRVTEVAKAANKTIPQKPNLILINAGTNDATQNFSLPTIGDRMNNLLSHLFDTIPGTTIILSTLLPNKLAPKRVADINDQYRQLAAERRKAGDRIVLAEMDDGFLTIDDLKDGTHPTDDGYGKMAEVWWAAIRAAEAEGILQEPADTGISDDTARDGVSRSDMYSLASKNYDVGPLFMSKVMIFVYILIGLGFQADVTGLLS